MMNRFGFGIKTAEYINRMQNDAATTEVKQRHCNGVQVLQASWIILVILYVKHQFSWCWCYWKYSPWKIIDLNVTGLPGPRNWKFPGLLSLGSIGFLMPMSQDFSEFVYMKILLLLRMNPFDWTFEAACALSF